MGDDEDLTVEDQASTEDLKNDEQLTTTVEEQLAEENAETSLDQPSDSSS